MSSKAIKIIGVVTSLAGIAVSLVSGWVDEQKMDEKINEKFEELLAASTKES